MSRSKCLPTQAVVPHRETIDAVANGILDGDLNAVSYFAGRDPALRDHRRPDRRLRHGRPGAHVLPITAAARKFSRSSTTSTPRASCTSSAAVRTPRKRLLRRTEITTVDDFKGVKIRSPEGLAAEVFKRVGAAPVSLPFSEVYTALEKGLIDAADASAFVNNEASGMHKVAKYPDLSGHPLDGRSPVRHQQGRLEQARQERPDRARSLVSGCLRRDAPRSRHAGPKSSRSMPTARTSRSSIGSRQSATSSARFRLRPGKAFGAKSPLAKEALDAHLTFMKSNGLSED